MQNYIQGNDGLRLYQKVVRNKNTNEIYGIFVFTYSDYQFKNINNDYEEDITEFFLNNRDKFVEDMNSVNSIIKDGNFYIISNFTMKR